jgi:PAS domain S-box-containing protein
MDPARERQCLFDVLETLPVYVILLTPDYHVAFANRFFRERFGEDKGRRCFEYLFGRSEPCENCETYKTLALRTPLQWEWTGPDGTTYDIHDFPFTDVDGAPLILEVGIDVTQRKAAEDRLRQSRVTELERANTALEAEIAERGRVEQALRLSEESYRSLFANMTEGFALHEMIVDEKGRPCDYRFLNINPAFERLTGLKREVVIGRRALEVLPALEPFWIETYGRVVLTGEPVHFENHLAPLERWYEVFAYRPAPGQFAAIFMDVTLRKRAEDDAARRMNDLEAVNEDLARFNRVAVGRELRMVELKKHVNELCRQIGKPPRYLLDSRDSGEGGSGKGP